jgi:hypothetical protein
LYATVKLIDAAKINIETIKTDVKRRVKRQTTFEMITSENQNGCKEYSWPEDSCDIYLL